MLISSARTAPNIAPGKKPAATALLGKEEELMALPAAPSFEAVGEGDETGVTVAPLAAADALDEGEAAVFDDFLSMTQVLPPWQVYPNGQHASPHLGRSSCSRVVLTVPLG